MKSSANVKTEGKLLKISKKEQGKWKKVTGRLTLPTDVDMVKETLEMKERLGADALRDCDGTTMPEELLNKGAKVYATYYTTRKDNEWAMQNPEEIQQEYLISDRVTVRGTTLRIELMKGFHTEQLKVNTIDDPKRWWEVMDRTTQQVVPVDKWFFDKETGEVEIETIPYHQYTVSFLAFLVWDPVHMYNFITNGWKDAPHQLTYDVRQPKTQVYVKEKLKRWCEENPNVDVVRFTTFFHQFTEVAAFEKAGKVAVINNSKEPQATDLYINGEKKCSLDMNPMEMCWIEL